MSFVTIDHKQANTLAPEGEYNVRIVKMEERPYKDDFYIGIELTVRDDVPQKYQNKKIFSAIFKSKETKTYHAPTIQKISKAIQLEQNKTYETIEQWFHDCVGKVCIVKVIHDTYNGETKEKVSAWLEIKNNELQAETVTIDNKDLPF